MELLREREKGSNNLKNETKKEKITNKTTRLITCFGLLGGACRVLLAVTVGYLILDHISWVWFASMVLVHWVYWVRFAGSALLGQVCMDIFTGPCLLGHVYLVMFAWPGLRFAKSSLMSQVC